MLKKLFSSYSILLAAVLLVGIVVVCFFVKKDTENLRAGPAGSQVQAAAPEAAPTGTQVEEPEEMCAVWVPFMSLDMSTEADKSEKAFQKKFDAIVQGAKSKGMNTLIVHVRPFGDALYPSSLYPWSHLLTGTQGQDPGYDPLAYMVQATHEAGLQFHAWVNPLRIQVKESPGALSADNPYNEWKEDSTKTGWTLDWGGTSGKYYNPAKEEVREFIAQGVREIVENYDVDGVQFDDYFYPTMSAEFDQADYDAYCAEASEPLSLIDWRKSNINSLVSLVYQEIKAVDSGVVFGIAPQGNIQNDENMGADVKTWCSTPGYIDYICPQLYVNFENSYLPFDEGANQWKELVTNEEIKLHFGLGLYKAGSDVDDGTWKNADDILAQQVTLGRELGVDGFMFYSYDFLENENTKKEVENVMNVL